MALRTLARAALEAEGVPMGKGEGTSQALRAAEPGRCAAAGSAYFARAGVAAAQTGDFPLWKASTGLRMCHRHASAWSLLHARTHPDGG